MDLNFHYFAVKAVAGEVGFTEPEAQTIAEFSQYIDDYDKFAYIKMDDVPAYALYLATRYNKGYEFNPVTTGFPSWYSMAYLILERYRKWIATPFHFIPERGLKDMPADNTWRVKPAQLDDQSIITQMLIEARDTFVKDGQTNREINLMRIGMLLHTFADTYAHQSFNGFWDWQNYAWLDKVVNNIDGKDVTDDYSPKSYHDLFAIGHAEANHAPDDSNVTFDMRQCKDAKDDYNRPYSRSNTREFLKPSREIADFLLGCLGKSKMSDGDWNALSDKLSDGFLTPAKDVPTLSKHWGKLFPNSKFSYDAIALLNSMLKPSATPLDEQELLAAREQGAPEATFVGTDKFFRFNVLADQTRVRVVGHAFP